MQTLITEAVAAGARQHRACALLGLSARTLERWRAGSTQDARQGPRGAPPNKLTSVERDEVLTAVNSAAYRDLSPNQIVPRLADTGQYLASESTIYRILREEEQLQHRGRAEPPVRRPSRTHVATGPDQVWSWDITYLKTPVRGVFLYLYLIMDILEPQGDRSRGARARIRRARGEAVRGDLPAPWPQPGRDRAARG